MDNQQHQNMRNHKEEKLRTNHQESDHHHQNFSSSSNSSSPSHEFSFTISFQQTKQIPPPPSSSSSTTTTTTSTTCSSSFAIDLSPADDIFFHGHLLPLTLLSHLPLSSPRSSTNSLDHNSFTIPKKDHFFHQQDHKPQDFKNIQETSCDASKGKPKIKSFSLFGIPKWRKGYEVKDTKKEKSRMLMSQVVKRYIRMLRPFLSFRNKKNNNPMQFHRDNTYSFSGNLLSTRGVKGQYYSSAPASMRTSPTNSGLLVATPTGGEGATNYYYNNNNCTNQYSSSDSTMEELQAAIQAAIAHCKKSISMED